jgi:NADH-quinone oxidoreductase subunit J
MLNGISFYFFAALAVASAVAMITRRNLIHAAIFFVTSSLATAGIFLQLDAEFLFIAQILLFAGGIAGLFLFAMPFFNFRVSGKERPLGRWGILAIGFALVLAAQAAYMLIAGRSSLRLPALAANVAVKNTEALGDALFQQYLLPFEIVSMLLLVAMIGAVTAAKRRA